MAKEVKTIRKCRSCDSKKIIKILSLGKLRLSDFIEFNKKTKKFPLELVLCEECMLLQLKHTVSKDLLYLGRYGYKSGINFTMQKELREIVNKALRKKAKYNGSLVIVDIGANDGTLLSNYPKDVYKVAIEPIRKFAIECKLKANIVINDFFNYESYYKKLKNKKAHIITVISCFYDMEEPNKFLGDIRKILDEDGLLVIQQNYLIEMLRQKAFDNIVHEHLEYYSLLSLENLLRKHGLEVTDVELSNVNGGSFRTYIANKGKRKISKSVERLRNQETGLKLDKQKIYIDFARAIERNKIKLNKLIRKLIKNNKSIYIYGASTRGNTLLQYFGLNNSVIKAAVERNSEKWGKKIASVGIPIISEAQARKEKPDYMLVLPWFFRDEFLDREKEYLASGGHFIFPLPEIEII